jgi:hypothetical protein
LVTIKTDVKTFRSSKKHFFAAGGLLPEKLIRKWGDVQFFSMASPHLHNGLWKGVFRAKLLINLPPAPTPEDTEAW